MFATEFLSLFK